MNIWISITVSIGQAVQHEECQRYTIAFGFVECSFILDRHHC